MYRSRKSSLVGSIDRWTDGVLVVECSHRCRHHVAIAAVDFLDCRVVVLGPTRSGGDTIILSVLIDIIVDVDRIDIIVVERQIVRGGF